jgi:hypothetical protein
VSSFEFYNTFDPTLFLPSLRVHPASDGSGGTAVFAIERGVSVDDVYLYGPFAMVHRVSDVGPANVKDVNPKLGTSIYALLVVNMSRPGNLQFGQSAQALVNTVWPGVSQQFTAMNPGLSVHKGPKAGWMWRQDLPGLGDRPLVKVNVVFNYEPNGFTGASLFSDYKISIDFYFDFWAQAGGLGAQAVYYEASVSPGKLKKLVVNIANLAAQLAVWQLNQVLLPNALATTNQNLAAKGVAVNDVFLLPGKQVTSGLLMLGNTERAGHTGDDATLVLESPVG